MVLKLVKNESFLGSSTDRYMRDWRTLPLSFHAEIGFHLGVKDMSSTFYTCTTLWANLKVNALFFS